MNKETQNQVTSTSCRPDDMVSVFTDDDTQSNNSMNFINERGAGETELPLTVLFKFIKSFSGDRDELNTFIQNTNSAFSLALPHQVDSLFLYVVSQISNNVCNEIEMSEIESWHGLKIKLKQYYGHSKHLVQAHEELETIKQYQSESITDFFKRVEKIKNSCIQAEINNCTAQEDLPGLKRAIQRTALRRFIIHCKPEISHMLRAREINNLNDAYNLALQEEKIINYTKHKVQNPSVYCKNCKSHSHNTNNCRKPRGFYRNQFTQNPNYNNNNYSNHSNPNHNYSNPNNSYNYNSKFCNYCKTKGHTINECRKRQFNNTNNYTNRNFQNPKVNHIKTNQHQTQKLFTNAIQNHNTTHLNSITGTVTNVPQLPSTSKATFPSKS